jgi:hypothetical protein
VRRCIGQALQSSAIEVFELRAHSGGYRLTAGDPQPPYTSLIEMNFSSQNIEQLDRQGRERRGAANTETRFDSVAEMLRAVGEYVDGKQAELRRIDNSGPFAAAADAPALVVEYRSRGGEINSEDLSMSFLRDASVRMYKRRARVSNPIDMLTRKR